MLILKDKTELGAPEICVRQAMKGWDRAEASDSRQPHQWSETGLWSHLQIPCLNYCPVRLYISTTRNILWFECELYKVKKETIRAPNQKTIKENSWGQKLLANWNKQKKLMSLL